MRFWEKLQLLLGFSDRTQNETGKSDRAKPTSGQRVRPHNLTISKRRAGEPVRLNATSEMALSDALKALEPGHKGWISFDDAARLFSPTGEHPSECDSEGFKVLGEFAAQIEHRSTPDRNAGQQRVYFTRIRTLNL